MKRGASGLCGILAIDKPYGVTSHDVVNRVRQITGERRVGHAGTLDPAATGLLLVGVGAATRLSEYLTGHDKEYDARIVFGIATDTDDAQGRVFSSAEDGVLSKAMAQVDAQAVLDSFTGQLEQLPPAYSAIKKNGVTAYKAAREGTCIELESRIITVHEARLIDTGMLEASVSDGEGGFIERTLPYWDVHFAVSKGTYIRALARDMGAYLGCGAYLGALRRTAVAGTSVAEAYTLEDLERRAANAQPLPWCDPALLLGFPVIELDERQAGYVENGRKLEQRDSAPGLSGSLVSCVSGDKLLAIYSRMAGSYQPKTVIPGGVIGVG